MELEKKILDFIPKMIRCDTCLNSGANHFNGNHFYCDFCWETLKQNLICSTCAKIHYPQCWNK